MARKQSNAAQAAKETAPEAVTNQEEAVAQEKAPEAKATQSEAAPEQEAKVEEVAAATTEAANESATRNKSASKPKYPAFLAGYIKAYPNEKVFHVTADKQVFLDKDYHFAKAHQNGLGKGEITTYNI